MQTEQPIYDSGKPDLLTRLLVTPVGLLFVWLVFPLVTRRELVAASICGLLGLLALFVVWFFETRLYFDSSSRQLVFRDANTFWRSRRVSLAGAEALCIRDVHAWLSSSSEICIRYHAAGDRWILRVPPGDPKGVAASISHAIGLPIIRI
jgi:hypothetical protein